jgi:hypothetical protein
MTIEEITSNFGDITKYDVYALILLAFFALIVHQILKRVVFPSFETFSGTVALLNSKGGIIFVLLILWIISFGVSIAFGWWIIVKGISPQNALVMVLISWLTGQAWGNANGALLKTMTGEEPAKQGSSSSISTTTSTSTVVAPKPVDVVDKQLQITADLVKDASTPSSTS